MKKLKWLILKYRRLLQWWFGDPAYYDDDFYDMIKECFPKFYEKHLASKK